MAGVSSDGPSPSQLREAIAEALWRHVSAPDLAHFCDVIGMPEGSDGRDPWNSKRSYVRDRLMGVPKARLLELAAAIYEQFQDETLRALTSPGGLTGVDGELKNLIFAAVGPKPRIVLRDAINNVIEIIENAETCLVYDRPLTVSGLTWDQLVAWWSETSPAAGPDPTRSLFRRLRSSLDSPPERVLFTTYAELYGGPDGGSTPALIPQVYLHYDPYTVRELTGRNGETLKRQRMDFLLLFGDGNRIVIEVDGKQHYAVGETASPCRYAEMAAEDRRLKLAGYDLYRFGGIELPDRPDTKVRLRKFFASLLARHGPSPPAEC